MEKPNIPYPRRLVTPWPVIGKLTRRRHARRRILIGGPLFWLAVLVITLYIVAFKLAATLVVLDLFAAWCVAVTAVWSAYAAARWASYGVASGMGVFS